MELVPCRQRVSPTTVLLEDGQVEVVESISEMLYPNGSVKKDIQESTNESCTSVGFSFKLLGFCYRLAGLLVYSRRCIHGNPRNYEFVFSWRQTWISIAYSSVLWLTVVFCVMVSVYSFVNMQLKESSSIRTRFNISLMIYRSTSYLLDVIIMVCQAPKLVKLIRCLIQLEKDMRLSKCELRVVLISSIILVLFQIAIAIRGAVFVVLIFAHHKMNLFSLPDFPNFEIPLKVAAVVWAVVTSFGQTLVQGTLIFICIFFRVCFKRLNRDIEALDPHEDTAHDADLTTKLVHLRLLYERTVQEISSWQAMLSLGILGSYAANLVLCCFGISIAITDKNGEESLLFWEVFVSAFLHLLVPTIASGFMKNEADHTKQVLNLLTIKHRTSSRFLIDEISNFRLTMRSETAVFSGAGLFDLDFPLILSIVQSIITYAVILLQTTDTSDSGKAQNETVISE